MTHPDADTALDRLLADDPPELRDDPEYRAHMRRTFAYQATVLGEQMRQLTETTVEALPRWAQPAARRWVWFWRRIIRIRG